MRHALVQQIVKAYEAWQGTESGAMSHGMSLSVSVTDARGRRVRDSGFARG